MSTTLGAMGLIIPTRGLAGSGQWADSLDANTTKLDAHTHVFGQGNPIPIAGIDVNADLPFGGHWGVTSAQRIQFSKIADNALTNSNNLSLFVSDGTGALIVNELYYRNSTGNAIRFTNGNALNSAAFVGGIVGDYSSVSAQVSYDDSTKRYKMTNGSADSPAHGWALMQTGSVRISETATTETQYVGLVCPAALATQYNITLPLAAPASTAIVQMDSAGVLTTTNTIANDVTLGGDLKRSLPREIVIAGDCFGPDGNSVAVQPLGKDQWVFAAPPGDRISAGLPLHTGDRVISIRWFYNKNSSAADLIMALQSKNNTTITVRDSLDDVTSGAAQISTLRTINYTLASGDAMSLKVQGTNTTVRFSHAVISYDRP